MQIRYAETKCKKADNFSILNISLKTLDNFYPLFLPSVSPHQRAGGVEGSLGGAGLSELPASPLLPAHPAPPIVFEACQHWTLEKTLALTKEACTSHQQHDRDRNYCAPLAAFQHIQPAR